MRILGKLHSSFNLIKGITMAYKKKETKKKNKTKARPKAKMSPPKKVNKGYNTL